MRLTWSGGRFLSGLFLIALALVACSGEAMPQAENGLESPQEPQATFAPDLESPTQIPTAVATALPAIPERRRLTLEWPPRIRVGDSDILRLTLEMDTQGQITPTAEFAGHETTSEIVSIPNLYDTHNVLAEARLDLAGPLITPTDITSQPLRPGEKVDFFWSVQPQEVGDYRGTVWLFLRFIPLDGSSESVRPISAQVVEIQAVNLLGLGGAPARWVGALGSFLGSLLGLGDILSWLRRRRAAITPERSDG